MTHRPPDPSTPTPPTRYTTRQWVIPFAVVGAIVATIIIGSSVGSDTAGAPVAPAETLLKAAHDQCSAGVLSDGDRTMTLDMAGKESSSGTLTFDQVTCVLGFLGMPSSVGSRMDATRALDGMQDGDWDGFHASWTYHPDNGLDIILTEG